MITNIISYGTDNSYCWGTRKGRVLKLFIDKHTVGYPELGQYWFYWINEDNGEHFLCTEVHKCPKVFNFRAVTAIILKHNDLEPGEMYYCIETDKLCYCNINKEVYEVGNDLCFEYQGNLHYHWVTPIISCADLERDINNEEIRVLRIIDI